MHDAPGVRTVPQAHGVAQLVDRFLHGAFAEQRRVTVCPQAVEGDHGGAPGTVRETEHEVQVVGVEIALRDRQDALARFLSREVDQRFSPMLPTRGVV